MVQVQLVNLANFRVFNRPLEIVNIKEKYLMNKKANKNVNKQPNNN